MKLAEQGDIEHLKEILDSEVGKDVNLDILEEKSSYTALHYAAKSGNVELVKLLVEHGAMVDFMSVDGTPLDLATKLGKDDIASYLGSFKNQEIVTPVPEFKVVEVIPNENTTNASDTSEDVAGSDDEEQEMEDEKDGEEMSQTNQDASTLVDDEEQEMEDEKDGEEMSQTNKDASTNGDAKSENKHEKSEASKISHKRKKREFVKEIFVAHTETFNELIKEYNEYEGDNEKEKEVLAQTLSLVKEAIYRDAINYGVVNFLKDGMLRGKVEINGEKIKIDDEDVIKELEHNIRWSIRYAVNKLVVRPVKGTYHLAGKALDATWKGVKKVAKFLNDVAGAVLYVVFVLPIDDIKLAHENLSRRVNRFRDSLLNRMAEKKENTYKTYRVNEEVSFGHVEDLKSEITKRYLKFDVDDNKEEWDKYCNKNKKFRHL